MTCCKSDSATSSILRDPVFGHAQAQRVTRCTDLMRMAAWVLTPAIKLHRSPSSITVALTDLSYGTRVIFM